MDLLSLKLGFGAILTTGLILLANSPTHAAEFELGGINLSEHCYRKFGGEARLPRGHQDAYSWRCIVIGGSTAVNATFGAGLTGGAGGVGVGVNAEWGVERGVQYTLYNLSINEACQQVYQGRADNIRAYPRNSKDPMSWICVGTPKPNVQF